MPEKSQKRKLRSDQSTSQFDVETASSINDENTVLSERDFEDISNKIENRISKRLKDTELNQREILKLIENLSSKVDNLSSVNSEQGYLTTRAENSGNPTDELEENSLPRNESSNSIAGILSPVAFCLSCAVTLSISSSSILSPFPDIVLDISFYYILMSHKFIQPAANLC